MKKLIKFITVVTLFMSFSLLKAEGIADIYFYKAKPGKYQEAADLMREGRDLGLANGQSVIVHQQNMGKGGEKIFVWVDFFEIIRRELHKLTVMSLGHPLLRNLTVKTYSNQLKVIK